MRQMAINAGLSPDLIVKRIEEAEPDHGYDFMQDRMVHLKNEGVIDPVKVTRCALENAVSVASTLLTTGHAIVQQ